jgi:probable HAF family extracellular repeat protein
MLVASAAVPSSGSATQVQARWQIRDLGTLGGRESYAAALNEKGRIVGWAETRKGKTHPFLWRGGSMTDLGALGHPSAWATAINNHGQIIGGFHAVWNDEIEGYASATLGFAWEGGKITGLIVNFDEVDAPDDANSGVRAINERGQMVGWVETYDGSVAQLWEMPDFSKRGSGYPYHSGHSLSKKQFCDAYDINEQSQAVGECRRTYRSPLHAVLWENGHVVDLGTLGGNSSARAITDEGQVVGRTTIARRRWRAFLWQDGEMRDLGTLPGWPHSSAIGLNSRGQVIGWSSKSASYDEELPPKPRAFLWQDGKMRDLGTLGGKYSIAYAINEAGQVVGQSQTANGLWHAFVWQNGKMTALPTLGGKYSAALAVNDAGQIVGWSRTRKDVKHAVLWTLKRGT